MENGKLKIENGRRGTKRCEVCRRELSLRKVGVLHDDTGDHDLCDPCAEVWSGQIMTYFARDLMAYSEIIARAA